MSSFSAFTELHGHHEFSTFSSPILAPPPSPQRKSDAGRLSVLFQLSTSVPFVSCLCLLHMSCEVYASVIGSFPHFKGRSGCDVSVPCSCYCQVVLGPVTTMLCNRPSVVDLRVVLGDVFRGQHDRNEFFRCLRGRGWES